MFIMERSTAPWYLSVVNHRGVVSSGPQGLSSALEQYCWYTEPEDSFRRDDGSLISTYPQDGIGVESQWNGTCWVYAVFSMEDL